MDLEEAYLTLHKASGIEVGDEVKIMRSFKTDEMASKSGWSDSFKATIGSIGVVTAIDKPMDGFGVTIRSGTIWWPFFCLELIEKGTPPLKIAGHEVIFTDKGIKVGCEEISHEDLEKLFGRLHERK